MKLKQAVLFSILGILYFLAYAAGICMVARHSILVAAITAVILAGGGILAFRHAAKVGRREGTNPSTKPSDPSLLGMMASLLGIMLVFALIIWTATFSTAIPVAIIVSIVLGFMTAMGCVLVLASTEAAAKRRVHGGDLSPA